MYVLNREKRNIGSEFSENNDDEAMNIKEDKNYFIRPNKKTFSFICDIE
jgi:hypothetical protein